MYTAPPMGNAVPSCPPSVIRVLATNEQSVNLPTPFGSMCTAPPLSVIELVHSATPLRPSLSVSELISKTPPEFTTKNLVESPPLSSSPPVAPEIVSEPDTLMDVVNVMLAVT